LPGANTLAYLASLSATKEKSFITLTPGLLLAHQPRVEGEDIGEKKNKKSQVLIDYYGPNKHRECAYQQAPITILVKCH